MTAASMQYWGDVICRLGLRPALVEGVGTIFEGDHQGVAVALHWTPGLLEPTVELRFSRPSPDVPGGRHPFRAVPRSAVPVLSSLETGDVAFDAQVTLFGSRDALWLFDDDTREAVAAAIDAGAWLTDAAAGLPQLAFAEAHSPAAACALVDAVCRAVLRLTRPRSIGELVAGATTDQSAPVRAALAAAVDVRLADPRPAAQISAARNIAAHMPDQAVEWLRVLTRQDLADEVALAVIDAITACTSAGTDTALDEELVEWLDANQAIAVQKAAQRALTGVVRQLIVSLRGPTRDARIRHLLQAARTRSSLVEAICAVLVEDQLPNASAWLGLLETDDPAALVVRLQAWGRVAPSEPAPIAAYLEHDLEQVRTAAAETLAFHLHAHLTADRQAQADALAAYAVTSAEFRRAAAHICVRTRPAGAARWLLAVPLDAQDDPTAAADWAEAFEGLGDPAAEARLIGWLTADDPARMAAIEALGALGTRASIGPLTEVGTGFLVGGAVRRAAKTAIADIEQRVSEAAAITASTD